MRLVAILITLTFLATALPTTRADVPNECANAGLLCTTLTTSNVAGIPPAAAKTYYLYWAAAQCAPNDNDCRGVPPSRVAGILWEEVNGLGGLQRKNTGVFPGGNVPADTAILA